VEVELESEPRYKQAGWSIPHWSSAIDVSPSYTRELIAAGRIKSVKVGAKRLITTDPVEFLANLDGERLDVIAARQRNARVAAAPPDRRGMGERE
jgi:hypothetical protein